MNLCFIFHIVFFALILVSAIFDFVKRIIPNVLSICILILFIFKIIFEYSGNMSYIIINSSGGFITAFLFVGLPCLINKSMGGGDLKISAAAGVFLGIESILNVLFTAFASCAICGISLILINKSKFRRCQIQNKTKKRQTMPFAPFLLIGVICLYIYDFTLI